ncbi:hypothetical protein MBLNU459_g0217t2 [Dothideomycetes sp. NU459]
MPVSNQKAQEEARKITTALRDAFDMISRQYIKATEVIPPGWELIAADVVSNLSGCLTIAVNQAVPGLIDNYSTTVKLDNGMQIFGGDHGGASGGSAGYGKQDQSNVAPATRAPDPVPSAIPSYASDPAYGITSHALTCVGTVYSFVTGGTDHGVDWEGLASRDPSNQRNGLNVMTVLLKSVSSDFKPSQDPPSKDLSKVFTDVETVTTDLQTYVDKISVSGHKDLPTADTPEVKGWQAKMAAANALIIKLTTDARNITNIHSAPLVQTPDSEGNPADLKGGLRQQLINAATTKMTIAAEVMEASSVNYQKAIDKLRDTQTKLGAIQASLAGLTTSNISPDMTRAILVKCIDILVQLNSQINRLKGFFDAVSTLVARFADDQVGPFIRQLRGDVSMPEKRLAGFTHTDFQRQMIFSFCISIHAYFGLFRDITSMFKEVLVTNIMPGLDLVNDFSTRYNSAPKEEADKIVASKQKQLASHSQTATQNVTVIVGRQQSEVFDNLQANASDAANDLGLVSVRQPGDAQSAIEMSTSQGKQAAAKGIDKSDVYIGRQLSDNGVLVFSLGLGVTIILGNERYGWDRHVWDVPLSLFPHASIIAFVAKIVFTLSATFIRLSLICFYFRLVRDSGHRRFRLVLWAAVVWQVAVCIVFVGEVIGLCVHTLADGRTADTESLPLRSPVSAYWRFPPPPSAHCLDEGTVTLTAGVINCVSDLMVTLLPIPIIMRLNMPLRQRVGVTVLLCLGILVTVAGIIRTYFIWKSLIATYDETWFSYPLWICAAVEIDLAVLCACAPALKPLFSPPLHRLSVSLARGATTVRSRISSSVSGPRPASGSGNSSSSSPSSAQPASSSSSSGGDGGNGGSGGGGHASEKSRTNSQAGTVDSEMTRVASPVMPSWSLEEGAGC